MMADSAAKILLKSLTQEEYDSLPGTIRSKLECCITEHVESFITSRAVLETTRTTSEDTIQSLNEQVQRLEKEREEVQHDLSSLKDELSEAQLNIEALKNDNEKLQATIKNLEADCVEYRRQRDLAVDERDEAMKMVERRNNELQRLQEDVTTLSNQLQAAVQAKCEALAKADEVDSLKLALDFKEKRLDQERGLLNQQIQSLSEDLMKHMTDMTNMRREHSNTLVTLRTQLSEKTEELKILTSQNSQLTETNSVLSNRVEVLTQKLLGQCDSENSMTENYQQEINAQTRLAELYKGLSEEASAKNEELMSAVKELQELLNNATQEYGDLETKLQEKEVALEVTLEKKNLCIQELKKELEHANELIEATKQQSIEKAVESLSPAAAATSRLLKSGLTLTQLYMQYAQASEQLMLEKEENKRLSNSINTILREIEQKAPILKKQREDYDYAMTTVESLTARMDEMEVETSRLRAANEEAEKTAAHVKRENKRLQDNLNDLGRQVCFLLKEVEESRGIPIEMNSRSPARGGGDLTTSAEVIAKHLVTFKDIQDLQVMNQKLLSVVRELSEKQEQAEREKGSQLVEQLESKLRLAEQRITGLQETETHYVKAMEVIKGQREMYRTLFQQQVAGLPKSKIEQLENSVCQQQLNMSTGSGPHTPESRQRSVPTTPATPGQLVKIEMLEQKLKEKTAEVKQLQDDFNTYKKEKTVNERMLSESLEKAREELRALAVSKSGVVAKAEYTEEKFKALKANADVYKAQIQALEKKNNNYSVTIAKHEQSITHLKDECLAANSQLSRAEVMLENLRKDYQMVKESEFRLLRERETTERQSSSQAMLMANLEMIKASFERTETETKLKLETKLEEAQKECSALRRRLQEEQDRFRERTDALERNTQAARTRLDEEKEITHQLRTQLDELRSELREAKESVEKLSAKVRTTAHKVVPDPETEKRAMLLESQLAEKVAEIGCLTDQLRAAKLHAQELSDISQSSEKQLLEVTSSHTKCKEELEAKIKSLTAREVEMRKVIIELEGKLSSISSSQERAGPSMDFQLSSATEELASLRVEVATLRDDLVVARAACQAAEEKYSHEMLLHADDMQAMNSVKKQLSEVSALTQDLEAERDAAKEALRLGQEGWASRESSYQEQLAELTQRLTDMDKQNNLLHDQLQELGLKVAVVSAQQQGNMSSGNLDTSVDDDTRSSDQLLQVLKYIRREKNIAVTQADALRAETLRLKAQVELQTRQLQEAREMLEQERSNSQESLLTSAKHEELLRKVDTLNALTDSNRLLREERDKLALQVTSLEQQLARVETEIVAGYKEKLATLGSNIDQLSTENTAIKAEAARWRARANTLIEKQNKNSPEDFRRLTLEKENLTKQINSANEELKVMRMEKSKLEEQLNTLRKDNQQQTEQMNNLQKNVTQLQSELTESKTETEKKTEELAKMTQDFTAQEATLNDIRGKEMQIRQIAKKYKVQFQELSKSNEEEKKKKEAAVMSPEEQERLREEGRQQEVTKQAERVRQLTEQVTTLQTEGTTLRKDIEALRSQANDKEERAKVLLKNARARIMLLTDEKRKLATENTELKGKADSFDKNKDDTDVRQRKFDKEKADLIAEKERLAREVEIANQRANTLQRQLDKLQGTVKPTTSSGVEKSSVEPPTANIKPMAGPSSSVTKQQPTQHSVTVTPWRGGGSETPFASIRPMSMQSRTVAVLPTTNQSSQAVLVPPQQQMVHTSTGTVEGLSSSPTSSHTDYMPATSSGVVVNIRQATVPPTQQPPPAESTQDMEVEAGIQAGAAANTQAIALVLPQPTAQTSTQTTQTSAQDAAVVSASTQQEQAVEQNVVSASNHMPSDQGLVSASSNQQSMCSTVPAYYRQDVDEAGPSTEQQSVVASSGSESQLAEPSNSAEQCAGAAGVASSYANSSNTVTTSQAGVGSKRLRDTSNPAEEEANKSMPPVKRGRLTPSATVTEGGEMLLRSDGLEVEYQVPTSSQRDQEDDVILVDSDQDEDDDSLPDDGGLDDVQEFEEEVDTEEGYELGEVYREDQEMASYDVGEGPDIDENITNQDNNEVEVNDDSNEVPNQSESSSSVGVTAAAGGVEGRATDVGGEATSSGQGRVSSNQTQHYTRRTSATHIPPLNRQHQLLLPGGYEEVGDDSIVPSTPTLFVPRRTDGFGEAVSSPHVPSGRFTFSDNNPPTTRAGVAQVASEGMDDTRMDLSQLEDSSTGRSVPSTPLQVSPQGEVGQSNSAEEQTETNNNLHIPTISISQPQDMPPPSEVEEARVEEGGEAEEQDNEGVEEALDEPEMDPEESGDGVSSEGEKSAAVVEEVEEGREAEATEIPVVASVARGIGGTARRSARGGTVRRRATTRNAPTPIVWEEDPPSSAGRGTTSTITIGTPRGGRMIQIPARALVDTNVRGNFRGRGRRPRLMQYNPRF